MEMTNDLFADLDQLVQAALHEDVGSGDVTASLIPEHKMAVARVISREDAVLCGTAWFDRVFSLLDPRVTVKWSRTDGETLGANGLLCEMSGPARALVTGERTALNLLQTLSGTATVTRHFVAQLAGTKTMLLDTRKTIPGLRKAQKYAVRCGHGYNHRIGLYDGILIKENHIAAAGSITAAIAAIRRVSQLPIETEVEAVTQIPEAIAAGANMLLLDNFDLASMREAVGLAAGRVKLEASGGFGLDGLREVAETGVDFISVGALTKHLRAVDLSMRFME